MDLEKGTFISSVSPYPEEEYYLGKSSWSANASDWDQRFEVGDVIADPSGSWTPGTAEAYIDQQIAAVTGNLASETIARQTADQNLQTQINSEVTTRYNTDQQHTTQISQLETTTSYLQSSLSQEMATRQNRDTELTNLINEGIRTGGGIQFDNTPISESVNAVTSNGIFQALYDDSGAYNVTLHHPTSGVSGGSTYTLVLAYYAIPSAVQRGGLTIKYVDSVSLKYVTYKLRSISWPSSFSDGDWELDTINESLSILRTPSFNFHYSGSFYLPFEFKKNVKYKLRFLSSTNDNLNVVFTSKTESTDTKVNNFPNINLTANVETIVEFISADDARYFHYYSSTTINATLTIEYLELFNPIQNELNLQNLQNQIENVEDDIKNNVDNDNILWSSIYGKNIFDSTDNRPNYCIDSSTFKIRPQDISYHYTISKYIKLNKGWNEIFYSGLSLPGGESSPGYRFSITTEDNEVGYYGTLDSSGNGKLKYQEAYKDYNYIVLTICISSSNVDNFIVEIRYNNSIYEEVTKENITPSINHTNEYYGTVGNTSLTSNTSWIASEIDITEYAGKKFRLLPAYVKNWTGKSWVECSDGSVIQIYSNGTSSNNDPAIGIFPKNAVKLYWSRAKWFDDYHLEILGEEMKPISFTNHWKGKTICMLGTSITYGATAQTCYSKIASDVLGFNLIQTGVPGQAISFDSQGYFDRFGSSCATIAEYSDLSKYNPSVDYGEKPFIIQDSPTGTYAPNSYNNYYRSYEHIFKQENLNADLYVFAVAPNNDSFGNSDYELFDFINWKYSDNSSFSTHRNTFFGALVFLLNELWTRKPDARIAFLLETTHTVTDAEPFMDILSEKYHIPFIKLYKKWQITPFNKNYEYSDNSHPTTLGHIQLAQMFINELLLIS